MGLNLCKRMFILSLIVLAVLLDFATAFRSRYRAPPKEGVGKIAEFVASIAPAVIVFSVFGISVLVVLTFWDRRKSKPTPDEVFETLSELERNVATLLDRQNALKKDCGRGVYANATQASHRLVKWEEAAKKRQKLVDMAFLTQVQVQTKLVDGVTKIVEDRVAVEKVREKERNSEVEELLEEWANWKKARGQEDVKELLPEEYIHLLRDRRGKTYFPQDLKMSLPLAYNRELNKSI